MLINVNNHVLETKKLFWIFLMRLKNKQELQKQKVERRHHFFHGIVLFEDGEWEEKYQRERKKSSI